LEHEDDILLQLHGIAVIEAGSLNLEPGIATYDARTKRLIVCCKNGTLLGVEAIKQENKKLLTAGEWWNGMSRPGNGRYIKLNCVQ
jgi:methionyl-tRNA formyltransferase